MRKLNWRWILGLLLVFLLIRQGHFSLVTVILIIGLDFSDLGNLWLWQEKISKK